MNTNDSIVVAVAVAVAIEILSYILCYLCGIVYWDQIIPKKKYERISIESVQMEMMHHPLDQRIEIL